MAETAATLGLKEVEAEIHLSGIGPVTRMGMHSWELQLGSNYSHFPSVLEAKDYLTHPECGGLSSVVKVREGGYLSR